MGRPGSPGSVPAHLGLISGGSQEEGTGGTRVTQAESLWRGWWWGDPANTPEQRTGTPVLSDVNTPPSARPTCPGAGDKDASPGPESQARGGCCARLASPGPPEAGRGCSPTGETPKVSKTHQVSWTHPPEGSGQDECGGGGDPLERDWQTGRERPSLAGALLPGTWHTVGAQETTLSEQPVLWG